VGEVIGNHINMLNVDTVALDSHVTMYSPLFEAVASAVRQNTLPLFWRQLAFRKAALGELAGIIGIALPVEAVYGGRIAPLNHTS
jgi:hypothetical protein